MAHNTPMRWGDRLARRDNTYGPIEHQRWDKDTTMLLIDARLLSYAVFHTHSLSTSSGVDTTVTHGIIEKVQGLCESANTGRWCLVWDGTPAYRRGIFTGYKIRQDRERTPEEQQSHRRMLQSIDTAMQVGHQLGWPQAVMSRVEADDLIGVFANTLVRHVLPRGKLQRVVLVTEDQDYYQLIRGDQVLVYRHRFGEVVNESKLHEMYGLTPSQFIDYKALKGEPETGDNIPKVEGIGDKTARKLIATHGSIKALHDHLDKLAKAKNGLKRKADANLHSGKSITHRAYRLSEILTAPGQLYRCYEPGQRQQVAAEWSKAHAQLVHGLRVNRPAHMRAHMAFKAQYEFDAYDAVRWCKRAGYRLGF